MAPWWSSASSRSPTCATAERYLAEGSYFWNSGMFVVRASVWMAALERFRADIASATRAAWERPRRVDATLRPPRPRGVRGDPVRVDRLRGDGARARPLRRVRDAAWCRWTPAGTTSGAWDAVWQVQQKDGAGNATPGDVVLRRQPQHAGACHQPPRRRGRAGQRGGGRNARCRAGQRPQPQPGGQAHRRRPRGRRARRAERCTARCTGPGAGTTASTRARAFRSSASWSSRARH